MKKHTAKFVLLIFTALVIIFIGLVRYASASLPIQDPEFAPASVLIKQNRDILIGKVLILIGMVIFAGSIIWRFIEKDK